MEHAKSAKEVGTRRLLLRGGEAGVEVDAPLDAVVTDDVEAVDDVWDVVRFPLSGFR